MPKVLIVDDDADIRGLLRDYLKPEGMDIFEAHDGPSAMAAFAGEAPDLVLLDVMMPGFDGMEVCRRIRTVSAVPVVFLTGKTDEVDQLLAFGFGADDYVTKPFSPRTIVARVKAHLRRLDMPQAQGRGEADHQLAFGNLCIDLSAFTVELSGLPVELTSKEFLLLSYFARHPGRVLTKRQLVTGAWGEEYLGDDSPLMVHLSHLRQKLGDDSVNPVWIKTVRGVGYKFTPKDGGRGR